MIQILQNTRINFVRLRFAAYAFSGVTFLLSLSLILMGKLKMGVDFAGGHLVQVEFTNGATTGDIRSALVAGGVNDSEVQTYGERGSFVIRVPLPETAGTGGGAHVEQALAARFPGAFTVLRTEDVGPKVGAELSRNALRAVIWSLILILAYVAWRFELRFGVGAVLSMLHDVTICTGMLIVTGRELSLSIVAALLTVIGYSINDTIVVCDRIREELRLKRREALEVVINTSINKVLARTFITGLTTIFVLIVLCFFGGRVINDFAFTLLFGTLIGTYSSWFVAAPVVLEWSKLFSKQDKRRGKSE